jgi:uncharacterized membrane protein
VLIGIILILASAAAYNSAPVLLALEARSRLDQRGTSLVAGVLQGSAGLLGMVLGAVGWVLQLLALTRISVTLAWVLGASGVVVLLLLSHWLLHEPIGRPQVIGITAITVGMVAVGLIHPARSETLPALNHWLVLLFLLTPVVILPYTPQVLPSPHRPRIAALAAGTAYAVCNLLTKGLADLISRGQFDGILARGLGSVWTEDWFLPAILFAAGVAVFTVLGFMDELDAIQHGRASSLVPIIGGLQAIIPILLAPVFFNERWPAELWARVILGLGILLAVTGSFVLSRGSAMKLAHQAAERP